MKVCIDIGHGSDSYPPSKGIGDFAEWEFNNAVGKMAKELAEINGFEVYLSQPLDSKNKGLNPRIEAINKSKVEFGISIHANAGISTANGHEFWHWHTSTTSKKLASIMDANALALLPNARRGLKASTPRPNVNFGILRSTKMPFVLAEFGFFTNPEDLKLLRSEEFRKKCSRVVVKTMCDFVGKTMRVFPESAKVEPIKIPSWKVAPLQALSDAGIITEYHNWVLKLDEPAPNWLVFAMTNAILEELKNQK